MTTAVLLAAGRSERFGSTCKLQALFRGKPLVRHAAEAILATGLPALAVVRDPAVARLLPEFRIVRSEGTMALSLKAGIAGVDGPAAVVVLGDMPHVTAGLLLQVATSDGAAAAVTADGVLCPPVRMPRSLFPRILALQGDEGAAKILNKMDNISRIVVDPAILADIDQPEDLQDR